MEAWVISQWRSLGVCQRTAPGLEVHRHDQGVLAGRSQDDAVAVDERTLAGVPFRHGGPKLPYQVHGPAEFTRDGIHAGDMAQRPQGHDLTGADGRYGPRQAMITLDHNRIAVAPDFLTIGQRQAAQSVRGVFVIVIEDIDAAIVDGGSGIAFPQLVRPQPFRSSGRPLSGQGNFVRHDVGPVGTAKHEPGARKVGRLALALFQLTGTADGFLDHGLIGRTTIQTGDPGLDVPDSGRCPPHHQTYHSGQGQKGRKEKSDKWPHIHQYTGLAEKTPPMLLRREQFPRGLRSLGATGARSSRHPEGTTSSKTS